jgi:CheY-like chemotaxis protein
LSGIYSSAPTHKVVLFIAAHEDALIGYHALAKSGGFESELARDGYEGLLLAHLARPDVIVLDLRDSGLDGRWILHRLRAGVGTRALPIVVVGVSGAAIFDVAHDRSAGRLYAVDPDDHPRLLHVVGGLLEGAPPRSSDAAG